MPGMASDAQMTQSQIYWSSASPIAVSEMAARYSSGWGAAVISMKMKNQGAYPIRITKLIGGSKCMATGMYCDSGRCGIDGYHNLSDYYYIGAGDEIVIGSYFGGQYKYGASLISLDAPGSTSCNATGSYPWYLYGAKTVCQNSNSTPGTLQIDNFGFEYIQYMEGQQITKREIGNKPLVVKCIEPD